LFKEKLAERTKKIDLLGAVAKYKIEDKCYFQNIKNAKGYYFGEGNKIIINALINF